MCKNFKIDFIINNKYESFTVIIIIKMNAPLNLSTLQLFLIFFLFFEKCNNFVFSLKITIIL